MSYTLNRASSVATTSLFISTSLRSNCSPTMPFLTLVSQIILFTRRSNSLISPLSYLWQSQAGEGEVGAHCNVEVGQAKERTEKHCSLPGWVCGVDSWLTGKVCGTDWLTGWTYPAATQRSVLLKEFPNATAQQSRTFCPFAGCRAATGSCWRGSQILTQPSLLPVTSSGAP